MISVSSDAALYKYRKPSKAMDQNSSRYYDTPKREMAGPIKRTLESKCGEL